MLRSLSTLLLVALFSGGAIAQAPPRLPAPAMIHGGPRESDKPTLEYQDGRWLGWAVRDRLDNRPHIARCRARYYLQDIHQPEAKEILTLDRAIAPFPDRPVITSVLADGTVLIATHRDRRLRWIAPDGKVTVEELVVEGQYSAILQGFSDGVLLEIRGDDVKSGPRVDFAPFARRKIDMAHRIRVVAGESARERHFLRWKDLLAWDDCLLNVKDGTRRKFAPAPGMKPWPVATPTALDDQTLVLFTATTASGSVAISLPDGRVTPINAQLFGPQEHRGEQRFRIRATKYRIGYFVEESGDIRAVDLSVPAGRIIQLASIPAFSYHDSSPYYLHDYPPVVIADGGWAVAAKKGWKILPWLATTERPWSAWGPRQNGVQCRTSAAAQIEQGTRLEVEVEFRCQPAELPPGVTRMDLNSPAGGVTLHMTHRQTKRVFRLTAANAVDPRGYIHAFFSMTPFDKPPLPTARAIFALEDGKIPLPPGDYECRAQYKPQECVERNAQAHCDADQRRQIWLGDVSAEAFSLKVLPAAP